MKFAAWVQAPVATVNGPLTVVSSTQPSHGTLDCDPSDPLLDGVKPDGSFCYVPNPDFFGRDGFFYVVSDADGKLREASVTLTVLPQNDPPVLTPADPPQQITSDEDAVLTIPLTALINGGPGTTTITDVDRNDPTGGIAVTQLTGAGVWSFSLDGSVFVDIGLVGGDNALHLPYSADIRFTPSGSGGGRASFTYLAWDQTVGTAGNKSPATWDNTECLAGGVPDPVTLLCSDGSQPVVVTYVTSTAYSQDENQQPVADTLNIQLLDLPDAPVLIPSNPRMGTTDEHTPIEAAFDQFVTGVSDPDGSSVLQGVVLISAAGQGTWEYSLDGIVYLPLPALTADQALVLDAADRLRYTPDNLNGEIATVTYRAWDKSDGATAGDLVDASRFGGTTAYSAATDTGWVEVTDINDAPVLAPQSPTIGTTDVVTPLKATVERVRPRDYRRGPKRRDRRDRDYRRHGTRNLVVFAERNHLPEPSAGELDGGPAAAPQRHHPLYAGGRLAGDRDHYLSSLGHLPRHRRRRRGRDGRRRGHGVQHRQRFGRRDGQGNQRPARDWQCGRSHRLRRKRSAQSRVPQRDRRRSEFGGF